MASRTPARTPDQAALPPPAAPLIFVVRVVRGGDGRWRGIVERPRTGAKARFERIETVGALIEDMVSGSPCDPPPEEDQHAP